MKERVKGVAAELKDRRAECRVLSSEIDILKDTNNALNEKITQMEAKGMDRDKSSLEASAELSALRAQLLDMEKELQEAKDGIAAETQKGEAALSAYKKKAQQSLSVANARSAAAVQAKEEAELEARAARTTANTAMERAMAAEMKGKEALAEAKAYVKDMQEQVAQLNAIQAELEQTKTELERTKLDASSNHESKIQLKCELQTVQGMLEAEQLTNTDLKEEAARATTRSTELLEEVERLRRESQRYQNDLKRVMAEKEAAATASSNGSSHNTSHAVEADLLPSKQRSSEAEATIAMLQQELRDANVAIRELKETLKVTMEEQAQNSTTTSQYHQQNGGGNGGMNGDSSGGGGVGGMPLFYAMEKQAELTQARNEIARLASLLGDSESSKQEAIEERDEMKQQLDNVQSQLQRQSRTSSAQEQQVNMEYLKNVVLSFLSAKTSAEKKGLLPVIGTVLCLTPVEQQQAMEQLDKDGKLSLDVVTNSMLNLRWS